MKTAIVTAVAILAAVAGAQAPSNNSCTSPLVVFTGVNPQPPSGTSGQYFTNVGATDSSAASFSIECGSDFNKDVWFLFTAPRTGNYVIKTCTPSGFTSGSLSQTVVAIYDSASCPSGTAIACNDDSITCNIFGSDRSLVSVNLFDNHDYLVRVGTESTTLTGNFYLTIEAPTTAANDNCTGAVALSSGANAGTFEGSNGSTTTYGCSEFGVANTDVWFSYTGTFLNVITPKEVVVSIIGAADMFAVYTGTCSILPPASFSALDCSGANAANVLKFVPGIGTYYIRVGRSFVVEPSLDFTVIVEVNDIPDADTCANGILTFGGVQPSNSDVAAQYSNVGATDRNWGPTTSCVLNSNSDVWFDYIATTSGKVYVSTSTPSGQTPGTLTDTVVAVFADCATSTAIACNDDSAFGFLSYLEFDAVQGVHYKIMVAAYSSSGNTEGTFWLSIIPKFNLSMSSPLGAGSLRINLVDGGPNHAFFTCITLNAGSYPYGPFYGIEPSFTEILLQLSSFSEPFVGVMNGLGAYQFGPLAGLPGGLNLYAVTLEFDAVGNVAGVSNRTNHLIP